MIVLKYSGGFVIKPSNKKLLLAAVIVFAALLVGLAWWSSLANRQGGIPQIETFTSAPENKSKSIPDEPFAESVARRLDTPWALDFLPDGGIIFTERAGRIRLIDAKEGLLPDSLLTIDEVVHTGEGGLLGIAVHPDFTRNPFVYVYYTYRNNTDLANKVVRFRMQGNNLLDEK